MIYKWIKKESNNRVLIFFNGWGMDEVPFEHLQIENSDLIVFYDYNNLEFSESLKCELLNYSEKNIIAWSMGVWSCSQLITPDWNIDYAVAINGTLFPINDTLGIPVKIYQKTLESMSDATQRRFFQRMFLDRDQFSEFVKVQPQRSLENQINELSSLQKLVISEAEKSFEFNKVIVSSRDRIIPVKNQQNYWAEHKKVISMEAGHFPFFSWNRWDDILNYEV